MDLDFQEMEKYLEAICNKKTFIYPKELHSLEECERIHSLFVKYRKDEVRQIIKKKYEHEKFNYELLCCDCQNRFIESGGINKFIEYTKDLDHEKYEYICNTCKIIRKNKLIELEKIKEVEREKCKQEATSQFIEMYLDENKAWVKELNYTPYKKYSILFDILNGCNQEFISEYIKSMPYKSFLKTPYWSAIALYTKYRAKYSCTFCNSKLNLVTHHKTYANHGEEIYYLNDLVVLCDSCHSKHHNHEEHT